MTFHAWRLAATLILATVRAAHGGAPAIVTPCHIDDVEEAVSCIALDVPRDWNEPRKGIIKIGAAIVPQLGAARGAPPLFVLPGGPGQAGTETGALVEAALAEARKTRDIVLFDPRGTGRSHALRCKMELLASALDLDAIARDGARCRREIGTMGDVITHDAIARDIDALRAALGAETIDLWGGSYGTKLAQAYAVRFPGRTRAMVLDAALTLDLPLLLTAAGDADRAWERLAADCAADAACDAAFPGIGERLFALLARLDRAPLMAELHDPTTSVSRRVTFDRMGLGQAVRGALYVPQYAALLPYAVARAEDGDPSVLYALNAATASWSLDTMYLGQTLALLCGEEIPLARAHAAEARPGRLIGDSYYAIWAAACRDWPRNARRGTVAIAHPLGIPVLLLAGALDPVTPPARAQAVAANFTDAVVAVAPAGGHTISPLGCVPSLIARFLEAGTAKGLDMSCLATPTRRPPFVTGPLGPAQ